MFDVITFQIVKYPSALRNVHSKTELQQIKSIMNADTVRLQVPDLYLLLVIILYMKEAHKHIILRLSFLGKIRVVRI
jgi:hypothetical protein